MTSRPCVGSSALIRTASARPGSAHTKFRHQWMPYERYTYAKPAGPNMTAFRSVRPRNPWLAGSSWSYASTSTIGPPTPSTSNVTPISSARPRGRSGRRTREQAGRVGHRTWPWRRHDGFVRAGGQGRRRLALAGRDRAASDHRDGRRRDGRASCGRLRTTRRSVRRVRGAQQQRMRSSLVPLFSSVCQAPAGMRIASPGRTIRVSPSTSIRPEPFRTK